MLPIVMSPPKIAAAVASPEPNSDLEPDAGTREVALGRREIEQGIAFDRRCGGAKALQALGACSAGDGGNGEAGGSDQLTTVHPRPTYHTADGLPAGLAPQRLEGHRI